MHVLIDLDCALFFSNLLEDQASTKMVTEILGTGGIRTDMPGYTKLVSFFERCKAHYNTEILIAFEHLTWIDANMSAMLMAIIQKLMVENSNSFFVDEEVIKQRFDILIRNGWLAGVEFVSKRDNKSAIKLTGFYPVEDVRFIQYIEQELLSNKNLGLNSEVKGLLTDAFLELFCNVQKHARTESPVFACGQYFPSFRRLSFTLVDCGVGYFLPIKEFTKNRISTAKEAILWALEGNTTKTDAPGGLGLRRIQKFCAESGSTFSIITGGEYWTNTELFPLTVKPFCGTVVNVIFDCSGP